MRILTPQEHGMGIFCPQLLRQTAGLPRRRGSSSSLDSGFSQGRGNEKIVEAIYSGGYVTQNRFGPTAINLGPGPASFQRTPPTSQPDSRQLQEAFSYLPSDKMHGTVNKTRDILTPTSPSFPFHLFGSEMSSKATGERLHSQMQVPGKNVIDLERIARGLDTRTTVCLHLQNFLPKRPCFYLLLS